MFLNFGEWKTLLGSATCVLKKMRIHRKDNVLLLLILLLLLLLLLQQQQTGLVRGEMCGNCSKKALVLSSCHGSIICILKYDWGEIGSYF